MKPFPALRMLPMAAMLVSSVAAAPSSVRPPQPGSLDAEQLVHAVEKRYASIHTLTASFTQTFRSGELAQSVVERGRIFVRRPGQMRWDYREPDKKVFVVEQDGSTLSYVPSDLTAVRARLPQDAPHLELLMGRSNLLEDFAAADVTLKDPAFPGSRALKLVPRKPMSGIEMVYLEIEPRMMTVERVLVMDPLGNESDLVLDKVTENAVVRPDVFDVRVPPGVTVRDATASAGP